VHVQLPSGTLKHLKSERILSMTSKLTSEQAGFGSTSSCTFPFKIHCSILPAKRPSQLHLACTLMSMDVTIRGYLSKLKDVREQNIWENAISHSETQNVKFYICRWIYSQNNYPTYMRLKTQIKQMYKLQLPSNMTNS
jgi:hypothetical protein